MANNLQIKRSAFDGITNPSGTQLAFGELGWNNGQNRLWIGRGTDNSADGSPAPYELVGRQATASVPGAAGFSADNFAISDADYEADNGSIVTIKDGGVANAELANSSVTIGTTAVSLGGTTASIAGLTGLDFTDANCIIGATVGDEKTISIGGHVNSKVIIVGDLQVNGDTTTVSSTAVTIADKTFVLGESATSAQLDDGGVLFSDVASILWDHGNTRLKSTHVIAGSYVDTTYSVGDGGLTKNNFTDDDHSKLNAIEASATADQTGAEMRSAIGTGNNNLVPAEGTAGHFLKHDGSFGAVPATYTLVVATDAVLGGVKIGGGISVTAAGVISADTQAGTYSLPVSTDAVLGGVKVGGGISVTAAGVISADTQAGTYSLPIATGSALGGVKIGSGISIASGVITADTQAGTYSLPLASTSRGGVKVGYTESGKNYPVELTDEKMFVNVPWTDTTYAAAQVLDWTGDQGASNIHANNISSLAADFVTQAMMANNSVGTAQLRDDEVTYAKMQNIASDNRILGNNSGDNFGPSELTGAEVLTMIGTIDGGTQVWG